MEADTEFFTDAEKGIEAEVAAKEAATRAITLEKTAIERLGPFSLLVKAAEVYPQHCRQVQEPSFSSRRQSFILRISAVAEGRLPSPRG